MQTYLLFQKLIDFPLFVNEFLRFSRMNRTSKKIQFICLQYRKNICLVTNKQIVELKTWKMALNIPLINCLLNKQKRCNKRNLAIICFLGLNAALYFISAINEDEFVGHYMPDIVYYITVRGFARRISDLVTAMYILFAIAVLIIYNYSQHKHGFDVFLVLKGEKSLSDSHLSLRQ